MLCKLTIFETIYYTFEGVNNVNLSNQLYHNLYMKKNHLLCLLVIAVVLSACKQQSNEVVIHNDSAYFDAIRKSRAATNQYFMSASGPVSDSLKPNFEGVNYFPVDTNFKVIADFEKVNSNEVFEFSTTGKIADKYKHIGNLIFTIQGVACKLAVYENQSLKAQGEVIYFVPFFDLTNSNETYGGGRYLDFKAINTQKVIIDFNEAYQPYCYYNHAYSCPIPPLSNKLQVAVRAGERM